MKEFYTVYLNWQYCIYRFLTQNYSGALAAQRAAKRSPIPIWERKGKLASGIARVHIRTTTKVTTESRKMAAILQLIG